MRFRQNGNLGDVRMVVIKNASSITINAGCPTYFDFAATGKGRGRDVIPSESAAASTGTIRAGMATKALAQYETGDALVWGFTPSAVIVGNTRAASTDTWASVASVASGALLIPQIGLAGVQGWRTTSGLPTTAVGVYAVMMQSLASRASQASTYLPGLLGDTIGGCSLFVREM